MQFTTFKFAIELFDILFNLECNNVGLTTNYITTKKKKNKEFVIVFSKFNSMYIVYTYLQNLFRVNGFVRNEKW